MKFKLATIVAVLLAVGLSYTTGPLQAQLPMPASTQFDITGFLQAATLDGTCAADAHCGGTATINGHLIVIPKETIVILPANAVTWQELFAQSPAPYTGVATGMALADVPKPLTTYEIQVVGNRVLGGPAGADLYIAGLVHVAQQDLNSGAGFINFMDYGTGEMRVGGTLGDSTTGARVRINDPANPTSASGGRYGRAMTPDGRFMVDQDNPTIESATGFPMCFPRTDPAVAIDPLCPQSNRPATLGVFDSLIEMTDPALLPLGGAKDPRIQAPFEVGDYVTYAGTLIADAAGTYISAHTISNNVAIYTAPGTNPAYVTTEVALIGTGGLTVLGGGEAAIRTRFEGMATDTSRNIHLYGIDVAPGTGVTSDRDWGTIGVDPGPAGGVGAVRGRWRFRPPCTAAVATDKACTPPPGGVFIPPTREVRAVIEGLQSQNPANPAAVTSANGIFYGQYHAPINEYIFPENVPGAPVVENNFNTIEFLAKGGYTSFSGVIAGVLNPWPSNISPTPVCTAPTANAGGAYSVAFNGSVSLAASATGTAPFTFQWAVPVAGTITPDTSAVGVYNAVGALSGQIVPLTVTATNACGSSTASSTVTVSAVASPTVNPAAAIAVASGANGSLAISGSDPGGLTPLTFTVAQAGAPALNAVVVTPGANPPGNTATVTFQAPVLAVGAPQDVVTLTITASNTAGALSLPVTTTVTVIPPSDTVTITTSEYRLSKQRLVLTANSNAPTAVLTLRPYLRQSDGTLFDPSNLGATFVNTGGGIWSLTLVGAPEPLCGHVGITPPACTALVLQATSNLGGANNPLRVLDRVRQ